MSNESLDSDTLAEVFAELALEAGAEIMQVLLGATPQHVPGLHYKADSSPVCDADMRAEDVILEGLSRYAGAYRVVAEEQGARGENPLITPDAFILVDPLDGTKEFVAGNSSFTVNIALIRDGAPVVGVVYAPAQGKLWLAGGSAQVCDVAPGGKLPPASERRTIKTRPLPQKGLVAMVSRLHRDPQTDMFLQRLPIGCTREAGSSLKLCVIASGEADVYPRFSDTMEWDIAAGDAVLRKAGGIVVDGEGAPMVYGKVDKGFLNGPFVAWGDPGAAKRHILGGSQG